MPARSAISLLPEDIRRELDKKLLQNAFSSYTELASWLREQGFEISRSTLHRYGQKFEQQLSNLKTVAEQIKAIGEVTHDDENLMGDALTRLAQEKLFRVLVEMEQVEDVSFPALVRAIADLNRSSVTVKKYQSEVRQKAKVAAEEVEKTVQREGLSPETAAAIRAQILGIVE